MEFPWQHHGAFGGAMAPLRLCLGPWHCSGSAMDVPGNFPSCDGLILGFGVVLGCAPSFDGCSPGRAALATLTFSA